MVKRSDVGMSLVEVLITLVISSLLLTGLVGGLIDVMGVSVVTRTMASSFDQQRFVSYVLTHHIHGAGWNGCQMEAKPHEDWFVKGLAAGKAWPRWLTGYKSHTDGLLMQGCMWHHGHYQWLIEGLYVAKTSYKDSQGHRVYGLYQKILGSRRQELVSGVNDLGMTYGLMDKNGKPYFVNASQIKRWSDVRVVKVRVGYFRHVSMQSSMADPSSLDVQEYDVALRH